jgi:predicted ATP-dependent endonuclease of OLD family
MILEKIVIEDYKSISSLEWEISDNISCLVGQNESGKSNLLQVFDFLDPTNSEKLHFETHTRRGSERYSDQKLPYIKYSFKFSESSKKRIADSLKKNNIDLVRHGGIEKLEYFVIEIDEKQPGNQKNYLSWNNNKITTDKLTTLQIQNNQPVQINANSVTNINSELDNLLPTRITLNDQDFKITFSSTLENIKNGNSKNTSLFKLMKIAGLNDPVKLSTDRNKIRQYLKGLNRTLNKNFVKKYYSQDDSVKLEFVHDSGSISLDIEDNSDGTYVMEERSDGFKYFFTLLIEIASNSVFNNNAYFLLDEPGGRLHPSGQRDLLKYLEELAENHKIIYTTHSPFLINRLFPNRVRIVDRDVKKGTVFKLKGFSKNWKPMRSSLGLNIKDSFYYSDKALIVEGPEDIIFISSLIHYFNKNGDLNLNTDLFSFIDAGGESNLPAMVQIMIDDERPTIVLIDSDSRSTHNKLSKKVNKVDDKSTLDLIEIKEFKKEAVSIEDLLPYPLLQRAVFSYCGELVEDGVLELVSEEQMKPLNLSKIKSSRYNLGIVPYLKEYLKEVDLDEEKWNNKKTPISKVGIARHFEILLADNKVSHSKIDFKDSLKLTKAISEKLGLSD